MDIQSQIVQAMDRVIAKTFLKDEAYIAENHQLRFKEDLSAGSMQYFPIITVLEEEFDVNIDYHVFQMHSSIGDAIDFVLREYNLQHG